MELTADGLSSGDSTIVYGRSDSFTLVMLG
jgi:hypothetical protein